MRGALGGVVAAITLVAVAAPSSALSTVVTNSAKTVACTVEGRTPTYTRSSNGTVTVTGNFRVVCARTSNSVTSANINVSVGVVEMDTDQSGKLTVIDSTPELSDYSTSVTYKFGSYTYLDVPTKSFTCVNTDKASGDSEEIEIGRAHV